MNVVKTCDPVCVATCRKGREWGANATQLNILGLKEVKWKLTRSCVEGAGTCGTRVARKGADECEDPPDSYDQPACEKGLYEVIEEYVQVNEWMDG